MLVLFGAAVLERVRVGITVRREILCGPGDVAAWQTYVTFPVEGEVHRGGRCRVIWQGFCLFTLDIHWVAVCLRCLSGSNSVVKNIT